MRKYPAFLLIITFLTLPTVGWCWNDETHIAIAKVAGYEKWYNATGADMAKIKSGKVETKNHYVNNDPGTVVTSEMVLKQVDRYNEPDDKPGHLYGAILGSIRAYRTTTRKGKYAEYHLAFAAHYIGDLSQPLHNMLFDRYNRKNHLLTDSIVNDEVLDNLDRITIYSIVIRSEEDLSREIARIANQAMNLGYRLEKEKRLITKEEAYQQISHSASLFRAVLGWLNNR